MSFPDLPMRRLSLTAAAIMAMTVVGTPDYMAPESVDPLAVDLRSDIYARRCAHAADFRAARAMLHRSNRARRTCGCSTIAKAAPFALPIPPR